ncbi:MAG: type II CAAX endopeptidase family protein [Anaerolineales bacterium]
MKTQHSLTLTSWRDRVGSLLRDHQLAVFAEIVIVISIIGLRINGLLPMSKIPLLLIGSLSLWLRRSGWRQVGMGRPASWKWTIVIGVGIAVLDTVFGLIVVLPLLHSITGEPMDLHQFNGVRGNTGELLFWLILSWPYAAIAEEMVYRGYLLNRLTDLFGHNKIGWTLSIISVSLIFGLAHGSMGITGVLNTFLTGVLYAVAYLAFGCNLWIPVVIHGFGNTIGFLMLFFGMYP